MCANGHHPQYYCVFVIFCLFSSRPPFGWTMCPCVCACVCGAQLATLIKIIIIATTIPAKVSESRHKYSFFFFFSLRQTRVRARTHGLLYVCNHFSVDSTILSGDLFVTAAIWLRVYRTSALWDRFPFRSLQYDAKIRDKKNFFLLTFRFYHAWFLD